MKTADDITMKLFYRTQNIFSYFRELSVFSLSVTNLTCIPILSLSSLRPLDVEFMKALHEKVNIVPVLAKADTLTPTEVKKKKIKVDCNNKPDT